MFLDMYSSQIFEMALGLQKPWFVKKNKMGVSVDISHGQIDIFLDFEKGLNLKTMMGMSRTFTTGLNEPGNI